MQIISYNVNGIRAAINKGLVDWLKTANPDVVCFQETKAQPEQIDDSLFENLGYKCYWFSAQKKGYSGVGIISKTEPLHVEYGMQIPKYDDEGRFIRADFDKFSVVSVYHPSGTTGDVRQEFKYQWLDDFREYVAQLRKQIPNLVLSGDYNICHKPIDIHDPIGNAKSSGFLPEERQWFTDFLSDGFVDTFRHFNPNPHQYTWWSYRANARSRNLGWRIDYHIVNEEMQPMLNRAVILSSAVHSDHCPILLEINS